ncbi:MAG: hypothetical protein LBL45_10050 [Treponema sp.]|nr:hypothetical protein [Treponema sp.]
MMAAAILLRAISGCASAPEKRMEKMAATAPDAVSWLVNAFKTKKIVFINETHVVINEEMFLTEHLRTFYDAGVRYVFIESELVANLEHDDMKYALLSLEQATRETDPFMVIPAEAGSMRYENFANPVDWLNCRDGYAVATIIETLNNARPDAKAIILYGGCHGITTAYDEALDNGDKMRRMPLGYRRLAEHYGSAFISLGFLSGFYIGRRERTDEWGRRVSGPRIVLLKDGGLLQDVFGAWEAWRTYYDGFITEGDVYFGTMRNYAPTDEFLRFMTWFLKEYALKAPTGDEYSQVEMDAVYLITCYSLKLYYGKRFNYAVWKKPSVEAGLSLLEAVEELEAYAFSENSAPAEMMDFHYTQETMSQYCTGMYSSSLNECLEF